MLQPAAAAAALQACPSLRAFDLTGCALIGPELLAQADAHCRRPLPAEAEAATAARDGGGGEGGGVEGPSTGSAAAATGSVAGASTV